VSDSARVAMLQIGAQETVLRIGAGPGAALHTLPLGAQVTAVAWFRHDPPTEAEIENAIAAVEDLVMPLHRQLPGGLALETQDAAIRQIAVLAGVADGPAMVLGLEAMERVFDRLAAVVMGRPAAQSGLPPGPGFAATLLILRELMHHLQFAAITVRS
jgi:exopolyphosphatase/pppGpp-phosphohydrolase